MSILELVGLIANISLALSFVIGLVFGIAQVKAAARDRRERLTLETLRIFQTRDSAELFQFIISAHFPKNEEEVSRLSSSEQTMFIQYSQQMEALGILAAENLISLELIDQILGSFVMTSWKKYEPVFSHIRKRDPYTGEYFQWLAERIEERQKLAPREPFYKHR